jgi:glycosyltransferase involved in cell wall biosynthesis
MGTTLPQTEKAIRFAMGSDELAVFELPRDIDFYQAHKKLKPQILSELQRLPKGPIRIILLDILPSTLQFLRLVNELLRYRSETSLVVFAFGNFLSSSELWCKLGPLLSDWTAHWIATSKAQAGILRSCLGGDATVSDCAIPIDEAFVFDPQARERVRSELQLDKDDILLIYAGRIATEKNVDLLFQIFERIQTQNQRTGKIRLVIAGDIDDEDGGLIRGRMPLGFHFKTLFAQYLCSADPRIKLTGKLPREDLRSYFMASDIAVSLSLFHEEEFGLSIAESRMSGLPLLVTPWGGHLSHPEIQAINYFEEGGLPGFDLAQISDQFSKINIRDSDSRVQYSREAQSVLGMDAIAAKLKELIKSKPSPFRGFDSRYRLSGNLQIEMKKHDSLPSLKKYLEFRSIMMASYHGRIND